MCQVFYVPLKLTQMDGVDRMIPSASPPYRSHPARVRFYCYAPFLLPINNLIIIYTYCLPLPSFFIVIAFISLYRVYCRKRMQIFISYVYECLKIIKCIRTNVYGPVDRVVCAIITASCFLFVSVCWPVESDSKLDF